MQQMCLTWRHILHYEIEIEQSISVKCYILLLVNLWIEITSPIVINNDFLTSLVKKMEPRRMF